MTPARLDVDMVYGRLRMIEDALASLASLGDVDEKRLSGDPIVRAAAEVVPGSGAPRCARSGSG